jgi:hypothetical protein
VIREIKETLAKRVIVDQEVNAERTVTMVDLVILVTGVLEENQAKMVKTEQREIRETEELKEILAQKENQA